MMSSCKLHRQLRFAYPAKPTQHVYSLSAIVLMSRHENAFELCHFARPVHELTRSWDAVKAKVSFIFSKI